jgi:hypothetical protein
MQKDELAVGIYGARIRGKLVSWKGKKGSLTCSKCGSKWNSYLFPGKNGRVCEACWKPENVKVRNLRWNRNHNQSDETKELKSEIVKLMVDRHITIKQVSEMIGIPKTSLANWFRGQFGKEGQKNMANRIRPKIDLLLSENNVGGVAIESTQLLADDSQFRCTVCGQIGTVGRCCGLDTREPLNDLARAELVAEENRKANDNMSGVR